MVITTIKNSHSFMVKLQQQYLMDVSSVTCDFAPCVKEDGNICPFCSDIDFEDKLITCGRLSMNDETAEYTQGPRD